MISGVFGAAYLAPVIQAGAKYATTQFKEAEIREKRRDPFGVNPDDGGVYPWDFNFADNLGFYRMDLLLRRGVPPTPVE